MRTVLVTGATRGTGRALANALAEAGWRVYALGHDRLVLDELRASQGILPMHAGLTDRDQLRALNDEIAINALVHATLRLPHAIRFSELCEADIDRALEVNLSSTLHLSHALLSGLAPDAAIWSSPCPKVADCFLERWQPPSQNSPPALRPSSPMHRASTPCLVARPLWSRQGGSR